MTKATTCPSGSRADLTRLSDDELLGCFRAEPRDSDLRATICEILVQRHEKLVRGCVRQYRGSPEPAEDLMQVGYVGLMKAINKFNPEVGGSLAAYAFPSISGELKRHFRDRCWQVHVKRSAQELALEMRAAIRDLTQQLGRAPDDGELARHLKVTLDQLADARQADQGFSAWSLDAPVAGEGESGSLGEFLGEDDPQVEHTLDMAAVSAHWRELPERQQRILLMRFYGNMTQAEIGARLGISQMHVSRLMAQSLAYLRDCLLDPEEDRLETAVG